MYRKFAVQWLAISLISVLCQPYFLTGEEVQYPKKGNAILIIIDALRPDHLGCYGCKWHTSPAIDALAKESLVFENAFSQSSYTLSSHASMFTSLYPKSHGTFYVFRD